jgi:alpha-glucosidase
MLLLTLRGTPTLYNGDEIGMRDVSIPRDAVRDPFERNVPGRGFGRDPERTPMQWDAGPHAGFSTETPWLPIADDYRTVNVAAERADPRSMLSLHRALIDLRRATPELAVGSYRSIYTDDDLLIYEREAGAYGRCEVALNLSGRPHVYRRSGGPARILISTHLDRRDERVAAALELRADEGVVLESAR